MIRMAEHLCRGLPGTGIVTSPLLPDGDIYLAGSLIYASPRTVERIRFRAEARAIARRVVGEWQRARFPSLGPV